MSNELYKISIIWGTYIMTEQTFLKIREGKRKREDLYLPILHFPVADPFAATNWIDTLGEKAFCGWLKLHTLVNRSNIADTPGASAYNVPRSIESLASLLKISKSTLYRTILKPLWNFGLIDLIEWKEQVKLGQKSMNVLVYPYPQNDKNLENQPLIQVRNYETDYQSSARIFALQGGRPKNRIFEKAEIDNRFKTETVDGNRIYRVNVDLINRFKNETVTVSKLKPINITNTRINNSKEIKVIDSIESEELLQKRVENQINKNIDLDQALIESLMLEDGSPERLIRYFSSYFHTYDDVNRALTTLYRANKKATKIYSAHIAAPIFLGYDDVLEQEYINVFLNCIRRIKNTSLEPIDDFNAYFYTSVLECTKNIYAATVSDSVDCDNNRMDEEDFYKFVEEKMNKS